MVHYWDYMDTSTASTGTYYRPTMWRNVTTGTTTSTATPYTTGFSNSTTATPTGYYYIASSRPVVTYKKLLVARFSPAGEIVHSAA